MADFTYAHLHNVVCHESIDDLRATLSRTSRDVISQLRFDGTTDTSIINTVIVKRYECLYNDKGRLSSRLERQLGLQVIKHLLDHGFNPNDRGFGGA